MLEKRIIPVLLLKGEGLVKTIKFSNPNYIGDPRNAVKIFNEKEVDEICILDIEASREGRGPNFNLIREIADEAFMPLSYGGGITSLEDIQKLFEIGIEKVVLNTALFTHPDLITQASTIYGDQSIVACLDIKKSLLGKYRLHSQGGKKKQSVDIDTFVQKITNLGIGEILINSIDKDGMMTGMDVELISKIAEDSEVPVVACGGVGSLEHIEEVFSKTNVSGVGAGSFFVYQGKERGVLITYPSREELNRNQLL